jgi:hypothetical protein
MVVIGGQSGETYLAGYWAQQVATCHRLPARQVCQNAQDRGSSIGGKQKRTPRLYAASVIREYGFEDPPSVKAQEAETAD